MTEKPDLTSALQLLDEAEREYENARDAKRRADTAEIEARNELNKAQKAFDAAVSEVRKNTPAGGWKDTTYTGRLVQEDKK